MIGWDGFFAGMSGKAWEKDEEKTLGKAREKDEGMLGEPLGNTWKTRREH